MFDATRYCEYCLERCELPPDVDMKGECGCCCQWAYASPNIFERWAGRHISSMSTIGYTL